MIKLANVLLLLLYPVKSEQTYSGALLYDCSTLRRIRFTTIFLQSQLRLQNDGLNGGISLCDDRFPAWGTNSSQNDYFSTADWQFQNGRQVNKMCLGMDSSLYRHRKWLLYGGSLLDGKF